ncbi:MAG: parallel beta-helix domain-containing protein [Ardenticatenaceae bacterium]
MLKWFWRIVLMMVALVVGLFVAAALFPIASDPILSPEEYGAGASSVEPSYSGLQREFPAINEPADNALSIAKADLGRVLFFDPVLSANDDISCATCHHPDYGFADGLPHGIGAGGEGVGPERDGGALLARSTLGLWNVAYNEALFWDGRAESLEEQSLVPLTHPDEMGTDLEQLVAELRAIPAYVQLFDDAFGGGGAEAISEENTRRALAAFQRTLISDNSAFDRYAAGNEEALTPPQRRGLKLFRSGATRCFECHAAPTFATNTFRVIGVPDDGQDGADLGRAAVADDASDGAFRVPSLRNVALTGPYMHNGSLATLEEVIDFYAEGGGRAHGMDGSRIDPFVAGFELTEQERADLMAYLFALTDESRMPIIPAAVPSGLPVVPRVENEARNVVAEHNTGRVSGQTEASREAQTITVQEGQTIQAALDRAQPGDTVQIPYGTYYESLALDTNQITLHGMPNEEGQYPILDGQHEMADGVIASGNDFTIGYLHVRNYTDNGVLVEGVTNVHFHDLVTENTGTYGVYPVQSTDVLIERVQASGVNDAAIYAGQCENVVVRDSQTFDSVIGIELENTFNGEVYNNHTYNNSLGIFVVLLPQLTSKISSNTRVYDNLVEDNNTQNFAEPDMTVAFVPSGLGILVAASDNNEFYNNTIRNNKTSGIALFNLSLAYEPSEIDVGQNPENNNIYNNQYENNGYAPDTLVANLGIPTGDILWDGTGFGNTFEEPNANGNFPPALPKPTWPVALQKVYWRSLNVVLGLIG